MVFSSLVFLTIFLPLVLLINLLLVRNRLQNIFLLVMSLLFYAWGEGQLVFMMLFSICSNFVFGLAMDKASTDQSKKGILILALISNLGLLFAFKYANFFVDNLNFLLSCFNISPIIVDPIQLPIGISFFTFQAMSYIIDLYYGKHPVQKNPFDLALYIALFPQLIAGPIVRYVDIYAQIKKRVIQLDGFTVGIRRFIIGLAKKVIIADTLGLVADRIFEMPVDGLTSSLAWIGLLCYSLQIYFDFSGYSDMAIGLGRMLGFKFVENFNYPYISKSIQEFWRRWHISLSTWFRDYLYIPLGGNRKGTRRTYINLLLVFVLCGIWHGAAWNFVIWGLFHGFFLVLERTRFNQLLDKLPVVLRHVYVLLVVMLAWVFFRAENLPAAWNYLIALFGNGGGTAYSSYTQFYLDRELVFTLFLGIILSMPIYLWGENSLQKRSENFRTLALVIENIILLALLILCVMKISAGSYQAFIYFRF